MKISVDIDCTPEEARAFLGLPDVKPLHEAMLKDAQARMAKAVETMDPEALMRLWMPLGGEALDKMQRMFWSRMTGGGGEKTG